MYFADFSNRLSAFISLTYKGKQILHISYLLVTVSDYNVATVCIGIFNKSHIL